jgi:hypothetical protein
MILCAACDHSVIATGAFLPEEEADFVCFNCYRAHVGSEPLPGALLSAETVMDYARRDRYRHSPKKIKPHTTYHVSLTHSPGDAVRRKRAKLNLLTLKNLPPGSYTATYRRPR